MRTIWTAAALAAAVIGTASAETGTFTDSRDGTAYKTVKIGNQTWMAENLNYHAKDSSWCYENNADNCAKYGRLYNFKAAKRACPAGWKLPDTGDWRKLVHTAGGWKVAGKKLKSTSGWQVNGGSTDEFGFSALPGGRRYYKDGSFKNLGGNGFWWTASEYDSAYAYYRVMYYSSEYVYELNYYQRRGQSVRCVHE
jgi:uncharacterized protein (TIGR02145 family)